MRHENPKVTWQDVQRVRTAHPEWTSTQIAEALECDGAYVRATCHRRGWLLPGTAKWREVNKPGRSVMVVVRKLRKDATRLPAPERLSIMERRLASLRAGRGNYDEESRADAIDRMENGIRDARNEIADGGAL